MSSSVVPAESSWSAPNLKWSYDVFLSFRGEDTRSNFTSHLDMALRQKGVNVFIDDKLQRGEQISQSLLTSIEEAFISVVVFSENYASSSWCLDELVKIIECKESKGHIVWPVFYKVDPSDIRKQTGSFGEALAKHQPKFTMIKIQTWRDALTTAANLSGWDLGTRKEADLIHDIVKEVLSILNHTCTPLYVAKYPVGIDSQLQVFNRSRCWIHHLLDGVYMAGIYGIGGIGKTTLAKALYNKIANQFEGSCFLSNVREASKQFNGLVQLQENLLYEILKDDLKAGNLEKGINIIRNRLHSKKVLIVLDDVDKCDQLEALVGGHDWFGSGSKIIVTTRNKHLLSSHEFDGKYVIRGLNPVNALELFSWYAFKNSHPSTDYVYLSERAITYCKGHPLALVVLGSFLCGRDRSKWKSILDEFENSLSKDISDILQISYVGLEDKVKDVFLDVSCLFMGEKVDYVKNMLNACHHNLDFVMIILEDLSLITIENDMVQMHDLIRQMGHKIVNGESSEPRKRSRLWLEQDILKVFIEDSGTDAIKAIKLDLLKPTRLHIDAKSFRNMKSLRLLMVRNATFSTKLEHLPDNIKWIEWHGFSHPSLPSCFVKKNLVGLDLQHSLIKKLGNGLKDCKRLEYVDLSHSTLLEKVPEFSTTSNIQELFLKNCSSLRKIPASTASLGNLVTLNLAQCSNLTQLPRNLTLKSLNVLNLSYCKKLKKLPDFSTASNLEELYFKECTNLRMIHDSIGSLNRLVILDLGKCSNLEKLPSYLTWKSLEHLYLAQCEKLEEIPDLSNASNLKSLYLEKCTNLRMVHESIGSLDELVTLDLRHCCKLEKLPSYLRLRSLKHLELSGCRKLEKFPKIGENMKSLMFLSLDFSAIKELPSSIGYLTRLYILNLRGCTNLISIPSTICMLKSLQQLHVQKMDATGCKSLARSLDINNQDVVLGNFTREFILMDRGIPESFNYRTISNSMRVSFQYHLDMEITLATCIIFKVDGGSHKGQEALVSCNIFIGSRLQSSFMRKFPSSTSEYTWLITTSSPTFSNSLVMNDWNHVTVFFEVMKCHEVTVTIRSCGVHLTEEVHDLQNNVRMPLGVTYTDFEQPKEWPSLEVVKCFAQKLSTKSDINNATLHAENYLVRNNSKLQNMNCFPLRATSHGIAWISGMEGMAETTLFKSICSKYLSSLERQQRYNNSFVSSGGFVSLRENSLPVRGYQYTERNRLAPQQYFRIFYDSNRYGDLNEMTYNQYGGVWANENKWGEWEW